MIIFIKFNVPGSRFQVSGFRQTNTKGSKLHETSKELKLKERYELYEKPGEIAPSP